MRQIGILCAAALVGLQDNVGNLASDHKKARLLAGKCHTVLYDPMWSPSLFEEL